MPGTSQEPFLSREEPWKKEATSSNDGRSGGLTFTLQQEVSPEAEDGHLLVEPLLLLREVHGEASTERLGRRPSRRLTEDGQEGGWEELDLEQEGRRCERPPRPHVWGPGGGQRELT